MPDDPKDPQDESPLEKLDNMEDGEGAAELSPKERFEKISHIALLMSYDLIDKLRYLEKETLKLPEDEITERLEHLTGSVELLREAYLSFADVEF